VVNLVVAIVAVVGLVVVAGAVVIGAESPEVTTAVMLKACLRIC
jgi:hypothetical protein